MSKQPLFPGAAPPGPVRDDYVSQEPAADDAQVAVEETEAPAGAAPTEADKAAAR